MLWDDSRRAEGHLAAALEVLQELARAAPADIQLPLGLVLDEVARASGHTASITAWLAKAAPKARKPKTTWVAMLAVTTTIEMYREDASALVTWATALREAGAPLTLEAAVTLAVKERATAERERAAEVQSAKVAASVPEEP